MADPPNAENVLERGLFGSVEYAVRKNGKREAKDWLESQPLELQDSFNVLFRRLVDEGEIHNETQFRRLKDQVWEFKKKIHRLLCYRSGNRTLLTHRIKKAGGRGKCPPSEIDHAEMIGLEHIEREARRGREL